MSGGGTSTNITSQWTFRDGRDYVLSITTTDMPCTVSFWISDQITGEEWTGCYDENGIEVITKRTGCFKSFQTFISMIKSAILKKSDAVIIELLNIEDLNAISLHRQQQKDGRVSPSNISPPLNLQFYGEGNSTSPRIGNQDRSSKFPSHPVSDGGADSNPMTDNNMNSASSLSATLNKKKYLIVTYVAEFDRVHYPLPLNYSKAPDLNVMQKMIMQLKAEVTSLNSANKELSSKASIDPVSGHSHESKSSNRKETSAKPTTPRKLTHVSFDASVPSKNTENYADGPKNFEDFEDLSEDICKSCSGRIAPLKSKIRDLENTIDFQRGEALQHLQAMDKLKNENHFLQHKLDAAEKYEIELWNEIQKLKEKVVQMDLDKEKEIKRILEERKDNRKNSVGAQKHRSRHDVFYRSYKRPKSPAKKNLMQKRSLSENSQCSRGSSGSYCTIGSDAEIDKTRVKQLYRRSISPYHPSNFANYKKGRIQSASPIRSRFDPTAYVAEKKKKQNTVASLRMKNLERRRTPPRSQSRSNSRSRVKSPKAQLHQHRVVLPSNFEKLKDKVQTSARFGFNYEQHSRPKTQPSLNQDRQRSSAAISERQKLPTQIPSPLTREKLQVAIPRPVSRPTSAPPIEIIRMLSAGKNDRDRTSSNGGSLTYKLKTQTRAETREARAAERRDRLFNKQLTQLIPEYISESNKNLLESALEALAESEAVVRPASPRTKPVEKSKIDEARMKLTSLGGKWPNEENYDITVLQTRLSALQTFLDTCKEPTADKEEIQNGNRNQH